MPLISVIIPAYNSARYIAHTLGSVHAQTLADYEVIVVDDGSTDDTAAVVARFPEVRYVHQANAERAASRNHGLRLATGALVTFVDADDWWQPTFLARLSGLLQAEPTAVAAYCGYQYADERGQLRPITHHNRLHPADIFETLLQQNYFQPNCLLIQRSALEDDPFDHAMIPTEDWDLWLRLSERGPFVGTAEPLAIYRQHAGNTSGDPFKMADARLRVLAKRFGPADAAAPGSAKLHHLAYASAYFWIARELLAAGYSAECDHYLARIPPLRPATLHEYHRLYEIIGSFPVEGDADALVIREREGIARLRRAFGDQHPALPHALAVAYLALGHMAYGHRQRASARRYLRQALAQETAIWRHPRWRSLAPRLLVPERLLP